MVNTIIKNPRQTNIPDKTIQAFTEQLGIALGVPTEITSYSAKYFIEELREAGLSEAEISLIFEQANENIRTILHPIILNILENFIDPAEYLKERALFVFRLKGKHNELSDLQINYILDKVEDHLQISVGQKYSTFLRKNEA